MKFRQKLLAAAKGISVWWGIYFILGCCGGFALKMATDFFMALSGTFEIKLYAPIMGTVTLALAVVTYFAAEAAKLIPKKILARRLCHIIRDEGLSDRLIAELISNARGDMKNSLLIKAAIVYCIRGERSSASETLNKTDPVSILDIAQSTGDFRTAAYYYCAEMILCIINSDKDGAAHAYDDGIYYLEAFADNDMVLTVLALYQTEAELYSSAVETVEKIKWRSLPPYLRKYGKAVCAVIAAINLVNMERYDDAIDYANAALEDTCSDYMTSFADDVIRRAHAGKKSSAAPAADF